MGERIRSFDWSSTSVGPPERWPQALKNALGMILHSRYQMFVWWGPEFINFYNDAYRSALGNRHPEALGRRASEVWSDIWDTVGPQAEQVFYGNRSTWNDNQLLVMERYGYPEETFFSYSYSSIPSDEGGSGGVFCACTETTGWVIGERRLAALRQLASATASAKSIAQTCELAAHVLREYDRDVSFALFYLIAEGGTQARLCARTGIACGSPVCPETVNLEDSPAHRAQFWPFREALAGSNSKLENLSRRERLPGGPWPEPTSTAMIMPLKGSLEQPVGFLVLGASPRRPFDDNYEGYFELIAGSLNSAITNARAYEEERKRAEQLAELDRAKTMFFSNVSHELRTPLTLILGPLEDSLSFAQGLPKEVTTNLHVAHRNGLRLLKLVNSILDFARIEAGRIEANYEPTDLSAFTVELASVFRSAIEKAGLRLITECPPLPEPVYVDRQMWEKIVLNLLSNAFKFTFDGEIRVRLRWCGERVELTVTDTGAGIPEKDLPKVFERFHRVRNAKSRTREGTGIGLALVQELARLHGGEVRVRSDEGKGSEFIVSIQTGEAHLPPGHIHSPHLPKTMGTGAMFYADEASQWLPGAAKRTEDSETLPESQTALKSPRGRILLADDNADMREYVRRLLAQTFDVEAVADGEAALESVGIRRPDLVLTDVMMPRLDGFGLLQRLRQNEQTRTIPIILLSARAGEESRLEGLDAGADDYLVKPFSARELVARVQSQLDLARLRREGEERTKRILDSITDGFYAVDSEGRFTELNVAARKVFVSQGVDVHAIVGRQIFEVFPEARETDVGRVLKKAIEEREPSDMEAFYPPWNRWYFIRCRPSPEGGAAIFFQDITAQKQAEIAMREHSSILERTVAERTAKLREMVTELESFSYSIAHDMRAPLRSMRGYADILRHEHGEKLDHNARDYLRRIGASAERLDALIRDVLDYSKVVRGDIALQSVNTDKLVHEIVESYPDFQPPQAVILVQTPLPNVLANPAALTQVVSNLLSNAVKFVAPNVTPRIAVRAECKGAWVRLWFEDNGIGIPPHGVERIFKVFQRMHPADEYEGTGIGLAIIRKAIERMGGRVGVESEVGKGSRFWVELQKGS